MTPEALESLALDAIDDVDMRLVLADALREAGWWDDRVALMTGPFDGGAWTREWFLVAMSRRDVLIVYACMTQADRGEPPGGMRYRLESFIKHLERTRARARGDP